MTYYSPSALTTHYHHKDTYVTRLHLPVAFEESLAWEVCKSLQHFTGEIIETHTIAIANMKRVKPAMFSS